MSKYDCPNCGSTDAKSLQYIWNEGNVTSSTRMRGMGVGTNFDDVAVGVGWGQSNTTTSSALVRSVAPPIKPKNISPFFIAILGFFSHFFNGTFCGGNLLRQSFF